MHEILLGIRKGAVSNSSCKRCILETVRYLKKKKKKEKVFSSMPDRLMGIMH